MKINRIINGIRDPHITHYDILQALHDVIRPEIYVEIGVNTGNTIILANNQTKCFGIDPENNLMHKLNDNTKMFFMKSDDFFKNVNLENEFANKKIDLAFIDGMHLFEYALRDFINIEKNSHKNTVVLIHDTISIPNDERVYSRVMWEGGWTGDVFKVVMILKKYRKDLFLYNYPSSGVGACMVKNLDPNNTILQENYDRIYREYLAVKYNEILENLDQELNIYYRNIYKIKKDITRDKTI